MSQIFVNNLTFAYDGSYDTVFENAGFNLDTARHSSIDFFEICCKIETN